MAITDLNVDTFFLYDRNGLACHRQASRRSDRSHDNAILARMHPLIAWAVEQNPSSSSSRVASILDADDARQRLLAAYSTILLIAEKDDGSNGIEVSLTHFVMLVHSSERFLPDWVLASPETSRKETIPA